MRRSKGDRALLEGPHLVAEAVVAGIDIEFALATPEFLDDERSRPIVEALGERLERIDPRVLASVSDAESPRGILAVAALGRGGIEELPVAAGGLFLFADGVQEPGNLGALARVAEAADASGLALGRGCTHPNHPRALRASAGSLLRLPTVREVTVDELSRHMRPLAPTLVALTPRDGDDLYAADLGTDALVLMIGAEGPGLDPDLVARADRRITVPMAPTVESLNATVAAAVALYELRRRRG